MADMKNGRRTCESMVRGLSNGSTASKSIVFAVRGVPEYLPALITSADLALVDLFGWQAVVLIVSEDGNRRRQYNCEYPVRSRM